MAHQSQRETAIQRAYYARTASQYDDLHQTADDEHNLALLLLSAAIEHLGVRSVLDIGSGTGRALLHLKRRHPDLRIVGVEPSPELRERGHAAGLTQEEIVDGDATHLDYANDSFDLACEFGTLHHIRDDETAAAEMTRVARLGVFLSDCNNFGMGGKIGRIAKHAIHSSGLWWLADLVKTRGKGYHLSEGDGLAYSYSVFDSLPILRRKFPTVHLMSTKPATSSYLFNGASHVAVLALR